jgi:hypothetical protein
MQCAPPPALPTPHPTLASDNLAVPSRGNPSGISRLTGARCAGAIQQGASEVGGQYIGWATPHKHAHTATGGQHSATCNPSPTCLPQVPHNTGRSQDERVMPLPPGVQPSDT